MSKRVPVKRVTMTVYCLAEDAALVAESMREFFRAHEVGLWQPHGPRVDNGAPEEAEQARKFHIDEWQAISEGEGVAP